MLLFDPDYSTCSWFRWSTAFKTQRLSRNYTLFKIIVFQPFSLMLFILHIYITTHFMYHTPSCFTNNAVHRSYFKYFLKITQAFWVSNYFFQNSQLLGILQFFQWFHLKISTRISRSYKNVKFLRTSTWHKCNIIPNILIVFSLNKMVLPSRQWWRYDIIEPDLFFRELGPFPSHYSYL